MELSENAFALLTCLWKSGFNVIIGHTVCSGGTYNKGVLSPVCLNLGYLLDPCPADHYQTQSWLLALLAK